MSHDLKCCMLFSSILWYNFIFTVETPKVKMHIWIHSTAICECCLCNHWKTFSRKKSYKKTCVPSHSSQLSKVYEEGPAGCLLHKGTLKVRSKLPSCTQFFSISFWKAFIKRIRKIFYSTCLWNFSFTKYKSI